MNSLQVKSVLPKITPVIFTGNTVEYFGIWIVNLLLSILTLGVYSAWAKVRRKKYFYNNTSIEQVGFDYHAKPVAILSGRVIAVALLLLAATNPILQSMVFVLIFIMLPWLVIRGSTFNARNSSHRGLRFDFAGKIGKSMRVFIGLPLLTMISFGLAAPYAAHEKNQFLVNNHRYGLSKFKMKRVVTDFYKVYLILIMVPFIGAVVAVALPAYQIFANQASNKAKVHQIEGNLIRSISPIDLKMAVNNQVLPQQGLQLVQKEISQPSIAHNAKASEENRAATLKEKLFPTLFKWPHFPDEVLSLLPLTLILSAGFYSMLIFGFLGYLKARIGNLVWNNTTLDKLSFSSHLRARDFAWIYFSNIVMIMLTIGLATPWAQIRLARYRISKLTIISDGDFDGFVNDKKAEVKATGEEIADLFDVDLNFG